MKKKILVLLIVAAFCNVKTYATLKPATPGNFTTFISGLVPGDTLMLSAGNYTSQLALNNLNGTSAKPIVIMGAGNTTVFLGNACCQTVNIVSCSYIVLKNFKIDGQNIPYIEAVKSSGGGNVAVHHITLENLYIVGEGGQSNPGDNQTVAISTKTAAWNWIIRGCTINGAGTGLYLGNSDGTCPFVGGLIENNLILNTHGYNMQIKMQNANVRSIFPGTSTDYQKTIIRYNVWSKDSAAYNTTGLEPGSDGSRPVVLLDNFPASGYGANDMYEFYGNFIYNNPTEALMQVTGNTTMYSNVFVNHVSASGYNAVVITNHNSFPPRTMNVFHNTILSKTGGVSLSGADAGYKQYCYDNAVFSTGTAISGFAGANSVDHITDTYANAGTYVNSPSTTLTSLDVYPKAGQLKSSLTSNTLFTGFTDYNKDFNGNTYDWTYRGAYSGSGVNPGTHLKLEIRTVKGLTTGLNENYGINDFLGMVHPNPANNNFDLDILLEENTTVKVMLADIEGRILKTLYNGEMLSGANKITTDVAEIAAGFYLVNVQLKDRMITRKMLIEK